MKPIAFASGVNTDTGNLIPYILFLFSKTAELPASEALQYRRVIEKYFLLQSSVDFAGMCLIEY